MEPQAVIISLFLGWHTGTPFINSFCPDTAATLVRNERPGVSRGWSSPATSVQEKGPELTVEIMHLSTRRWQLLLQTLIVAPFTKASEAQICHLTYQQDTQISARIADTLSGLPAGAIWEEHCMGYFGVAHQSLRCPFLTPLFSQNAALNPAWSWNQWFCFPIWNIRKHKCLGQFFNW